MKQSDFRWQFRLFVQAWSDWPTRIATALVSDSSKPLQQIVSTATQALPCFERKAREENR